MNTIETVSRGVAWNIIATVVLKGLNLATLLVILRELTLYQYGQVELTLAAITTVSLVGLPAIVSVALADISVELGKKNIARAKGLYLAFLKLHVGLGALGSVFIALFVYFFGTFLFGQQPVILFLIALLLVCIGTTRNCFTTFFQANLAYAAQSAFSIVEELLKLVVVAVLIFIFHLGALAVILSIVFSQIFTQMIFFPYIRWLYRSWGNSKPEPISMYAFITPHARWSILNGFAGTISQTVRPWIVKIMFGTEAVALFSVAWGLVSQLTGLIPIATVLNPLLPRTLAEPRRFKLLLEKGIRYQGIAYVLGAVAAFFIFPILIYTLFPKYIGALPLFKILLLCMLPMGLDLFTPAFLALKAQKSMFFATVAKIGYYVVFLVLGGFIGGLYGLGLGFVIATMFYVFERYRRLLQLLPDATFSLRDFLTIDEYDKILFTLFKNRFLRVLPYFK